MPQNWDFYFCQVDGKPASIFLDLAQAPRPELPCMAYLRLFLRSPRPDGLSSDEEAPALDRIEDALGASLKDCGDAVFVGCNTSDGLRDLIFYAGDGSACERRLAAVMRQFPGYKFETGSRPDPEWRVYRCFLYPDASQRQSMQNRRVYAALQLQGDPLTQPREIDHWIYFPDAYARSVFIDDCRAHGFQVRTMREPDKACAQYGVRLYRSDSPDPATFDAVTRLLIELAEATNGEYDGWETQIVH